jgi:site-specific recombinase XerD
VRNRPATTVSAYRQDLAKFVAFLGVDPRSPNPLEGVDRALLRRYQIELAGLIPHPRTRARILVSLRSIEVPRWTRSLRDQTAFEPAPT